jgi:hypothetical protein
LPIGQGDDDDAGADEVEQAGGGVEDRLAAKAVEALDDQVAAPRDGAILDEIEELPQGTKLGVLPSIGAAT